MDKPKRHAFLGGMAAFDPSHALSGAMELRAHKTGAHSKYTPGYIFVESEEARSSTVKLLEQRRDELIAKHGLFGEPSETEHRQLTAIEHGIANTRVLPNVKAQLEQRKEAIMGEVGLFGDLSPRQKVETSVVNEAVDRMATHGNNTSTLQEVLEQRRDAMVARVGLFGDLTPDHQGELDALGSFQRELTANSAVNAQSGQAALADKVYVKGHGSPLNKDKITTRTLSTTRLNDQVPGDSQQRVWTLQSGFGQSHSPAEIAGVGIDVAKALKTDRLDVRITSCGGAGTYKDKENPGGGVIAAARGSSFAGAVQKRVDAIESGKNVEVQAYRGDTNSTMPSTVHGETHFRTKVKDDPKFGRSVPFANVRSYMQRHKPVSAQGRVRTEKVKTTPPLASKEMFKQEAARMTQPVVSAIAREKAVPAAKAVSTTDTGTQSTYEVRRSAARISMKKK